MSDLSLPPLELMPLNRDTEPADAVDTVLDDTPADGIVWPTPALASYPSPGRQADGEPCEVEGLNGRIMPGRLMEFDTVAGRLMLTTPHARKPVMLGFNQFRQLTLTRPLAPLLDALSADTTDPLDDRPAVPYRVCFRSGAPMDGQTVCPKETDHGVYLFEPVDHLGGLRRRFVPLAAYERLELGDRIGELLIQQQAATREHVEAAAREQAALRSQKIGDLLMAQQIVSAEQLELAIEAQSRMPMVRIGEAMVALGFVTPAQLDEALAQQAKDRSVPLGELLVRKGIISRDHLQLALSRKMGYPIVDLQHFPVEADALRRVSYAVSARLLAMPLMLRGTRLVVAMEDPARHKALQELEFAAQTSVVPVLARAEELPGAIARAYERLGLSAGQPLEDALPALATDLEPANASELLATLEMQSSAEQQRHHDDEPPIEQSDNSLVKLINQMILQAQAQGVSDIHIECQPGREKVRIRFRKDGLLRPYLELPHTYRAAIIARLKIMCDLDISERRKPQDGKITFGKFQPGARLELRLATIPTHSNLEDAVLRLLASAKPLPLDQLGLSPDNLAGLKKAVERPYGMLLCVGPTGSGKTTTLHSAMGYINKPDRKIWTAEDPIEITQPGLRQVQVNAKIDWTFARALRAFLRADPDVVMVGEIRDQETAQVSIEASLTGHLVLSTLHTNSAAETVTRLLDMGMDPFNFADSLLGVLAQRLVRRLCAKCRTSRDATPEEIAEWLDDFQHAYADAAQRPAADDVLAGWKARHAVEGRLQFHHSPGCPACENSGSRGRVAIHELLLVSRETRRLIQTGARAEQILAAAMGEGMKTLRQDGIEKVLAGLTTIEEVRATSNL